LFNKGEAAYDFLCSYTIHARAQPGGDKWAEAPSPPLRQIKVEKIDKNF